MIESERYRTDGSVGKHPLHQRDRRVFAYQPLEQHEIEREAELCQQAKQVTPYIAAFPSSGSCTLAAQDK